jgi:hypothetical protein
MSKPEPPAPPPPPSRTGQHTEAGEEQWHRVRIPGSDQGSRRPHAPSDVPAEDDDTPVDDPRTHTTGG